MPDHDSLRRLGGGRWETRDGRFAIEPQSGTWVIVDNDQTDELGLPLVRGPFGSLTAAKEAIEAARTEGPKASPLADRIEMARQSELARPKASKPPTSGALTAPTGEPEPSTAEPPPEPKWLRDLEPANRRRARDLIARLERIGVDNPERVVRAEIADGQPALARTAIERALAKAVATSDSAHGAVRAAVRAILRGADVELGVSWKVVDGDGREIEKVEIPE